MIDAWFLGLDSWPWSPAGGAGFGSLCSRMCRRQVAVRAEQGVSRTLTALEVAYECTERCRSRLFTLACANLCGEPS